MGWSSGGGEEGLEIMGIVGSILLPLWCLENWFHITIGFRGEDIVKGLDSGFGRVVEDICKLPKPGNVKVMDVFGGVGCRHC